jgi:hypothetical protein
MAVLNDHEVIYSTMRTSKCPYYKVFQQDKPLEVYGTNAYEPEPNIEQAINEIKTVLASLSGKVTVLISQEKTEGKGGNRIGGYFKWNLQLGPETYHSAPATPGKTYQNYSNNNMELIMGLMNQVNQKEIENIKLRFDFESRFKELSDKINGGDGIGSVEKNKLFDRALNLAEKLLTPANEKVQIAGTNTSQQPTNKIKMIELTEDQKKKLNACIHVLMTNDPNFLQNLEKLANLSADKPMVYQMAVQQLNSL